jgi:ADP-dependent phosphofructokinase/glucokinase
MSRAIVLGLGNNIDYEVRWDSARIERIAAEYGNTDSELRPLPASVKTERDLVVSLLGFLTRGSGGERFVESIDIIENFAKNFEKKVTLGGTAVRSAIAMRKLGYQSAVHLVTMNDDVRRILPPDCEWLCSAASERSFPHLIIQFTAETKVNVNDIHLETTRANRIIYTNDEENALMLMNPGLPSLFAASKVFLISGFNAMYDADMLKDRLRFLADMFEKGRVTPIVFFEDGGYHHPELSPIVREYLLKYIDIYSLNEDEFEGYLGRPVPLADAEAVLAALDDFRVAVPGGVIVLHTRYWALAFGDGAARYRKPLLGGITMATARFRFGDDFTASDYEGTGRLPPEEIGRQFAENIEKLAKGRVCCVPSFEVTEKDVTTIGLGDTFVGGFLPALI